MSDTSIVVLVQETLWTFMLLVAPILGVSILVGLIISILQATTSIQEQTLTFVPKLLGICAIGLFLASWISKTMVQYTENIYNIITKIS